MPGYFGALRRLAAGPHRGPDGRASPREPWGLARRQGGRKTGSEARNIPGTSLEHQRSIRGTSEEHAWNRRGAQALLRGPFGGCYGGSPASWSGRRGSRTRRKEGDSYGTPTEHLRISHGLGAHMAPTRCPQDRTLRSRRPMSVRTLGRNFLLMGETPRNTFAPCRISSRPI